jgi:thiol-disulfide isomerase/thioredoxin
MGLGQLSGAWLNTGEKILLSKLPHQVIALNIYSPNCIPCIKELPTLHRIQERLSKDPRFAIYIAVDPILVSESVAGGSEPDSGDTRERAISIMKKEIIEKNIKIPVIVLDPPFRVSSESFVTATPETILIRTNPWNIYYNFIGAISEQQLSSSIDSDPKVKFFFSSMGARNL